MLRLGGAACGRGRAMSAKKKKKDAQDSDDALALVLAVTAGAPAAAAAALPPPRPVAEYLAMSAAYSKALADDARVKTAYHCASRGVQTPLRSAPARAKQAGRKKKQHRVKQ